MGALKKKKWAPDGRNKKPQKMALKLIKSAKKCAHRKKMGGFCFQKKKGGGEWGGDKKSNSI